MKTEVRKLKEYILLWSTQSLSTLGSAMTSYALVLWLYNKTGSALQTALLSICTYAPYVIMSIFAGALSDRWNKKVTMLVCDSLAACSTIVVLILLKTGNLTTWHIYVLNALNGLMNTVQQPASEIVTTKLVPKEYYQKTSGMRSFSQSLNMILTPILASTIFAFGGMETVIAIDIVTFIIAFATLMLFIPLPEPTLEVNQKENIFRVAKAGLVWLRTNGLILKLILFLAFINLVASAFEAVLPAMILPKESGGETIFGLIGMFSGVATLIGSILVTVLPKPKNRIRAIVISLMLSMGTENFMLAFGHTPFIWCIASILGWITIPYMNANMDVIFRSKIPVDMQGRVYSCRNTLQFFTIPIGYFLGGLLVDEVFEPIFEVKQAEGILHQLFGIGKGAGATCMMFVLGIAGVLVCIVFGYLLGNDTWQDLE